MKPTRFAVLLSAMLPAALAAAPFPGSDLRPLLQFHGSFLRGAGPLPPVFLDRDDLFVTRDGSFIYSQAAGNTQTGPYTTDLAQGVAAPQLFATLTQALLQAGIGALGGKCHVSFPSPIWIPGNGYEITWYGRQQRWISLTMSDQNDVPDCTPDEVALLEALVSFQSQVLADPRTTHYRSH
ncbi:MAG TPA: hypothetical protein VHR45_20550 [Thermoanaerobaculia bacterium]|nr:hypothetical protein [Thermoanaerobaculia bacterium]